MELFVVVDGVVRGGVGEVIRGCRWSCLLLLMGLFVMERFAVVGRVVCCCC